MAGLIFSSDTPKFLRKFAELQYSLEHMRKCPEINELFENDPISKFHKNFHDAVTKYLLDHVENYIHLGGASSDSLQEIYACLHENFYAPFSSPLIQRLDLEELARGNRKPNFPDNSSLDFLERTPELSEIRKSLDISISSFFEGLNELSNTLDIPEEFNKAGLYEGLEVLNSKAIEVNVQDHRGINHDGVALLDNDGNIKTVIAGRIHSFIEIIPETSPHI